MLSDKILSIAEGLARIRRKGNALDDTAIATVIVLLNDCAADAWFLERTAVPLSARGLPEGENVVSLDAFRRRGAKP